MAEKKETKKKKVSKKLKPSRSIPKIKPGFKVRVHQRIVEGKKERIQVFEGLVIAVKHGMEPGGTFTVRRTSKGFGVEKIFPIHLPTIEKIEIVSRGKVRRAKLYYMRELTGRKARLKEIEEKK